MTANPRSPISPTPLAWTPVPWRDVFGDDRPVELEIGPGRGEILLAWARAQPHTNFFAVEHASGMATELAGRAAALGLRNVRVVGGDARCVVRRLVPDASVAAYHIYFPDPWPKTRHRHRRLFTDRAFAPALRRTLRPDGRLHVASDLPALHAEMCAALVAAGFVRDDAAPTPRDRPSTKFERKYAAAGTWYACFRRD